MKQTLEYIYKTEKRTMRHLLFISFLTLTLASCQVKKSLQFEHKSEVLSIKRLAKGVYLHISYLKTNDFGNVPCNGMIYMKGGEALVFDTPTNDEASIELLSWVESKGYEIKGVVATHFHEDCLGGLGVFHDQGIKSYASNSTIEILQAANSSPTPNEGFASEIRLNIGKREVILSFLGEGHTMDNIVGYIPSENTLFGGCLVKSVGAGRGYLGDANVGEWSDTVAKVKERWPDLEIVVPGHGSVGGMELLDFTIELFEADRSEILGN